MTLVSSFSHFDMDLAKVKPGTGVELLRFYLEYAASGGKRLGDLASTTFPMNSFEAEVFDVLEFQRTFHSLRNAEHPAIGSISSLSIRSNEADTFWRSNVTVHPTIRVRRRAIEIALRQQQLENLGWRFHRIWSTDWFMRKDEEVSRAVAAYENAVASVDNSNRTVEASTVAAPPVDQREPPIKRIRDARPGISRRDTITGYSEWELMAMIDWIESDGRLRSDEEIIEELLPELGFQRRGARIEGVLKSALEKHRNRRRDDS